MDSNDRDESRIETESQYELALRTLSRRSRPPRLLRLLMGGLEVYRQTRRMGWSRSQNKYGVKTFSTFKLGGQFSTFTPAILEICDGCFWDMSNSHRAFVHELVSDSGSMGFLFFQETADDGRTQLYESVTVSLGRIVPGKKRFRDRVDLILDAPIIDGKAGALSRVRLYIDPFLEHSPREMTSTGVAGPARDLLEQLSDYYRLHRDEDGMIWDHWTQDYIDYFGPRERAVMGTRFPTPLDDAYLASALVEGNSNHEFQTRRGAGAA